MSDDSKHTDAPPDLSFLDSLGNDDKSMDTDQRPLDGVVENPSLGDAEIQKREQAAEAHARAYAAKIIAKTKTFDDIPENHKYLIPKVRELLGLEKKPEVKPAEKSTKKPAMSPKEEVQFELRKEKLKAADISQSQLDKLNKRFEYLSGKGFSPVEALDEAITYAQIDVSIQRKEIPTIKTGGAPDSGVTHYEGTEDPSKMSRKDLAAYNAYNQRVAKS